MKRWAITVGLAVLGAAAVPAQDLPEWVRQIARIKFQERQNLARVPNYVCRETVQRFARGPKSASFEKRDTLRFDVAHVEGKDLLALPGASGFEEISLSKLVSSGMFGNGEFAITASNLFVADTARFTPREKPDAVLPVPLGFDFEIAAFRSGWQLTSGGIQATVGARGTLWVDPQTLRLQRIEQHAIDIPMAVGMSAVEVSIDYAPMQIGSDSVLLPGTAEVFVADLVGGAQRNLIEFSGCREFVSDSTIRFDTPAASPVVKKK